MSNLLPFSFDEHTIRVVADENGEPLFVGKDLCAALGYANPADAISKHCKGVAKRYPLQTPGGVQEVRVLTEADMFRLIVNSTLPAAERFEAWVFEKVLPSVRKTGGYTHKAPVQQSALPAPKVFTDFFKVGRLIGLDKNVAAISANQATAKLTGTNVLQLMGQLHIEAEKQEILFTPTELGLNYLGGINGRKVNMLLAEAGLQAKKGEHWVPLPAAEGFCRVLDTGKKHGDGTMIQQVKWFDGVVELLKTQEVA